MIKHKWVTGVFSPLNVEFDSPQISGAINIPLHIPASCPWTTHLDTLLCQFENSQGSIPATLTQLPSLERWLRWKIDTTEVAKNPRNNTTKMAIFQDLTNKPLEHTHPVISEDSLHDHLGVCSKGLLIGS